MGKNFSLPQLTLFLGSIKKCCSCVTRQIKKSKILRRICLISKPVKEEFIKRHKSDKFNGMCTTLKGTRFILDYSPNVIEGLMSGNRDKFLDALKTIYH